MECFQVTGGTSLRGRVRVTGAKNSALKLMAAALLAPGRTILDEVPDILDVSISGASLRAGREQEITPKQLALLDVSGDTGNVRVIWMRPEDETHLALGVQFLDPRPSFLPTLYRWLGRESALGPLDEG